MSKDGFKSADTESAETDVHVSILQFLRIARKKRPAVGGASGKQLMEALNLNTDSLREALMFLTNKELVVAGDQNFQITATGVDYLEDHPPKSGMLGSPGSPSHPPPPPPPWSPGDPPNTWPSNNDPDDPSRVPRRRKPTGSPGAIALPLPDPNDQLPDAITKPNARP
ncbi:MAG: hypothetical protein JST89_23120 [Cyanobacteria bacterium SZAS-4]|nr:hypothetical protein [Cyanobacteria bacterium SZAS-4]